MLARPVPAGYKSPPMSDGTIERALVIAAHPDDEVLGCGGTMARLAAAGSEVRVVILGEGITSRHARREQADPRQLAELRRASAAAGALLGARAVRARDFPDNRFDSVPLLEVVKAIEEELAGFAPDTVFTQHGGDLNIDHAVTFRAALIAARPLPGSGVKRVLAYEVASSTEWAFDRFAPRFEPNVFFDIAATLDRKLEAMRVYESESRAFPHPRSPEALRAQAARRGSQVGVAAAEAFALVREVR